MIHNQTVAKKKETRCLELIIKCNLKKNREFKRQLDADLGPVPSFVVLAW